MRFLIKERINKGEMADVFKAVVKGGGEGRGEEEEDDEEEEEEDWVVVKKYFPPYSEVAKKTFYMETTALRALSVHPNIISLVDAYEEGEEREGEGGLCCVMDFAKGGDLFDYVKGRGRLGEEEGREIFIQVLFLIFLLSFLIPLSHSLSYRCAKLWPSLIQMGSSIGI